LKKVAVVVNSYKRPIIFEGNNLTVVDHGTSDSNLVIVKDSSKTPCNGDTPNDKGEKHTIAVFRTWEYWRELDGDDKADETLSSVDK